MYFNATPNTFKIWAAVVIGVITFYETTKYLAWLTFHRRLRLGMLILFISAIFSHYYSWWVYINYWNDDFYSQWYHQLFFSITELISTILVILIADNKSNMSHRKALTISGIGLLHIFAGSWDQFIRNVLRGEGYAHQVIFQFIHFYFIQLIKIIINKNFFSFSYQVVRDLGFMIPDILHVIIPLYYLQWRNFDNELPGTHFKNNSTMKHDLMFMLGLVLVGLGMCSML